MRRVPLTVRVRKYSSSGNERYSCSRLRSFCPARGSDSALGWAPRRLKPARGTVTVLIECCTLAA